MHTHLGNIKEHRYTTRIYSYMYIYVVYMYIYYIYVHIGKKMRIEVGTHHLLSLLELLFISVARGGVDGMGISVTPEQTDNEY